MVKLISEAIPAPDLPAAPVTPLDPVPAEPKSLRGEEKPATLASLHIGQLIANRYQLMHRLAIGGMGEVWQVLDQIEERELALKILRPELAGQKVFLSRLKIEAKNASLVRHPNLAQVYDSGEENGLGWIAMELVEGVSLTQILEQEPVLKVDFLLSVLDQTSRALIAVHQANIVHRDIKPGNIMVTPEGIVKLTDFGISKASNQVTLTAAGMVMGTAQYLPPEQAIGKPATPAGDLYALGVIAFESLAGQRPFTGKRPVDIAFAHVKQPVPPLPAAVPEPLKQLVYQLLEKDPDKRPNTATSLVKTLTDLRLKEAAGELPPGIETPTAGLSTAPSVPLSEMNTPAGTEIAKPTNTEDESPVSRKPDISTILESERVKAGATDSQTKNQAAKPYLPTANQQSVLTANPEKSNFDQQSAAEIKSPVDQGLANQDLFPQWDGPREADGTPLRFLSGGTVPAPDVMPDTIPVDPNILHQRQQNRRSFDQITFGRKTLSQVGADYTGAWPSRRNHLRRNSSLDQALSRFTKQWLRGHKPLGSSERKNEKSTAQPANSWIPRETRSSLHRSDLGGKHSERNMPRPDERRAEWQTELPLARHSRLPAQGRSVEKAQREQTGLLPAIKLFPKRRETQAMLEKAHRQGEEKQNRKPWKPLRPETDTSQKQRPTKPDSLPSRQVEKQKNAKVAKTGFLERWLGNNRK